MTNYFKTDGSKNIFFVQVNNKPICLICNGAVLKFKKYNIKQQYVTNNAPKYDKLKDQFTIDKITKLKNVLVGQQSIFTNLFFQQKSIVAASYAVAKVITKISEPHSDAKFVKDCFLCIADVMCPEKKELFKKLSLSRQTIAHCTEELAISVLESLASKAGDFAFYLLVLDKSMDIKDTTLVAIFVCGVHKIFDVTKQLASVVSI